MHGWFYLVDYSIQTVMPSIYQDIYHFNELCIGLSYLPRGAGVITGGYINGKMMNRKYRITAKGIGHTVDKLVGDDLNHFSHRESQMSRLVASFWHIIDSLNWTRVGCREKCSYKCSFHASICSRHFDYMSLYHLRCFVGGRFSREPEHRSRSSVSGALLSCGIGGRGLRAPA